MCNITVCVCARARVRLRYVFGFEVIGSIVNITSFPVVVKKKMNKT